MSTPTKPNPELVAKVTDAIKSTPAGDYTQPGYRLPWDRMAEAAVAAVADFIVEGK